MTHGSIIDTYFLKGVKMKMTNIAKNVRDIRTFFDLTQIEFSKKCGLTQACVCQIESGQRLPSVTSVIKMSKALRVTTDRIILGVKKNASD